MTDALDTTSTPFVTFDGNGKILTAGRVPRYAVPHQLGNAFGVIEGEASDDKHYVDVATGTIQAKTNPPIVMSGDVFTNVPEHAWASVDGVIYPVTDGTAEFTFNFPGTYHITMYSVRFLPLTHTVVVP